MSFLTALLVGEKAAGYQTMGDGSSPSGVTVHVGGGGAITRRQGTYTEQRVNNFFIECEFGCGGEVLVTRKEVEDKLRNVEWWERIAGNQSVSECNKCRAEHKIVEVHARCCGGGVSYRTKDGIVRDYNA